MVAVVPSDDHRPATWQAWLAISAPEATTKTLMLRSRSLNSQTDEYRIGDFVYHFAGGLANDKGGGQKYAESKYVAGGLLSCMCELAVRGKGAAAEERGGGVGSRTVAIVRAVVGWVAMGLADVSFYVPLLRGLSSRIGGETPRACDAGSEPHAAAPSGKGHRGDKGSDGDKKKSKAKGGEAPHDGAVPASAWAGRLLGGREFATFHGRRLDGEPVSDCRTIERCKLLCADAFVVSANAIHCFRLGDEHDSFTMFGASCSSDELSVLFVQEGRLGHLDESCWPPPPPGPPPAPSPPALERAADETFV